MTVRLNHIRACALVVVLACGGTSLLWLWLSSARAADVPRFGAGTLLVAARELPDPNFAETVVLLVEYDDSSATGVVVNQPTRFRLSRVFEDLELGERGNDPVFRGGPVAATGVLALVRSSTEPKDGRNVFQDVYLANSVAAIEDAIQRGADLNSFRIFLGYAGWGPGQLDAEVALGSWHIMEGDARLIFDPAPASLWDRLVRRASMVLVRMFEIPPPTARVGTSFAGALSGRD